MFIQQNLNTEKYLGCLFMHSLPFPLPLTITTPLPLAITNPLPLTSPLTPLQTSPQTPLTLTNPLNPPPTSPTSLTIPTPPTFTNPLNPLTPPLTITITNPLTLLTTLTPPTLDQLDPQTITNHSPDSFSSTEGSSNINQTGDTDSVTGDPSGLSDTSSIDEGENDVHPLSPSQSYNNNNNSSEKITQLYCPLNDHCIILDWDDTLIATTHIMAEMQQASAANSTPSSQLVNCSKWKQLGDVLIYFLEKIKLMGDVYIVTNSEQGWVKSSCAQYIPNVWKLLENIPILSARTTYETRFQNNPYMWKYMAFQECIKPYHKYLISFGDNPVDHQVTWDVGKTVQHMFVKNIQFQIFPSIDMLIFQISRIIPLLSIVHGFQGDVTLKVLGHNTSTRFIFIS